MRLFSLFIITLAPKKLILTRRASEGSASEPSLARRVSMCKDAKLSCRGNNETTQGYYPGSKEGHIPTRSASEGSGAFPSLARRVNMQQHAELPCRGNKKLLESVGWDNETLPKHERL